ncbi:MAG: membrane dipeptidase [Proteobacteria bacterium]|nr:membrane dipeptidase [Pseudomonadota bacterium]
MRLSWQDLGTPRAENADGRTIELDGWPNTALPVRTADYFLLTGEPNCCAGCLPANPLAVVEIFAGEEIAFGDAALRLRGTWHVLRDDPAGWRYQLRGARRIGITRRSLLASVPMAALPLPAAAEPVSGLTIDLHSHAGQVLYVHSQNGNYPFTPVTEPMREGGMAVICLAVVSDSPTSHRIEGRIRPYRDPAPGELYAHTQLAFARLHRLVREQGLVIIRDAAALATARADRPSIIVSSEGGDFLDGMSDRVDEAYEKWQLRHLQLTHYRPNELGDIQTEPAIHDGLTVAGAEVIRRCNELGVVVDVAHGTYALVKKAAAVTTKPLVLSHTSLTERPVPWTRRITPDHARAIAATGGVIGVWPVKAYFGTYRSYAEGFARMVDVAGIDHVGLGTDQLGLVGASTMPSYADLPQLAAALRERFNAEETAKLLGANYQRVFAASLA